MALTRRQLLYQMLGVPFAIGPSLRYGLHPQTKKSLNRPSPPPLPTYPCRKVQPFSIDGDLQKALWRSCRAMTLVSATGKPARLQLTTVRACWSDSHLYVGFSCRDAHIISTFTKRDEPLYEQDVVEVFLNPSGDLSHYFEFEFSPHNVVFDARVFNPGRSGGEKQVDTGWDCQGLQSAVKGNDNVKDRSRRDHGWSVEIAIPFIGLSVAAPTVGTRWRGNFYRIDYATPTEFSAWSPTLVDPASYHVPERFGWLAFEES